jgi:hypothetical protein
MSNLLNVSVRFAINAHIFRIRIARQLSLLDSEANARLHRRVEL